MKRAIKRITVPTLIITLLVIAVWQFTGGDYYTKYEVVREVEKKLDSSDPLVAAGFYDSQNATETVIRDEFRLGLLPTPNGLFDKHALSVITVVGPIWGITFIMYFMAFRRLRMVKV